MTRLRHFVLPLLALIASPSLPAQLVHFGPWLGGVTPRSAEVVLGLIEDRLTSIDVCLKPDFLRYDSLAENRRLLTAPPKLVRYTLTNLEPDTTYYYRVRAGNLKERERTGSFRTFPEAGRPSSFRFAIGADALTDSKSSVFSEIRFQKPRFFIHLGNFHSVPILTPDPAKYYETFKTALRSSNQSELYSSVPIVYTWDRSDFGGERANRFSAQVPVANEVYRNIVPHYPLVTDESTKTKVAPAAERPALISQAFSYGRVRFIILDTRSARDPVATPDGPEKSMLGEWQCDWLKQELVTAAETHPLIFIASSTAWHGIDSANSDDWARYTHERTEIAAWIRDHNITGVCFLSGNGGVFATNDGSKVFTQSELNFPEFHVGPIDLKRVAYRGEWTQVPIVPDEVDEFFGLVDVEDNVTSIKVSFTGLNQYAQIELKSAFTVPVPRR